MWKLLPVVSLVGSTLLLIGRVFASLQILCVCVDCTYFYSNVCSACSSVCRLLPVVSLVVFMEII